MIELSPKTKREVTRTLNEAALKMSAEVGRDAPTTRRLNEILNEHNDAQRLGQQQTNETRCGSVLTASVTIDEPHDIACDLAKGHAGRHHGISMRDITWG